MAEREKKTQLDLPKSGIGKIAIVRAQFNSDITNQQLSAAIALLDAHGVKYDVINVTGSFELPYVIDQLCRTGTYAGVVAIGCLIKGESIHFEVIAYALPKQLLELSIAHGVPISFGIITALTKKQAEERTWIGEDAAYAVLESFAALAEAIDS